MVFWRFTITIHCPPQPFLYGSSVAKRYPSVLSPRYTPPHGRFARPLALIPFAVTLLVAPLLLSDQAGATPPAHAVRAPGDLNSNGETAIPDGSAVASDGAVRPVERPAAPTESAALGPTNAVPTALLQLPDETTGAIVADLNANRLYLYRRHEGEIQLVDTHYVTIGKNGAHKRVEGDERTPVGAYFVTRYIPDRQLPELYGVGAFPVNYPNLWDRRLGRTGSGIWIHGMPRDQATRPARSSRGCLALKNDDFGAIVGTVETTRTPVLVAEEVTWRTPRANEERRRAIAETVEGWRMAWESLDTQQYLEYYADDFRFGRMNRKAWARHKQRVNAHKQFIRIGLDAVGIYEYPGETDLVLVDFRQSYRSSNFNGTSQKRQYWRLQADGAWRIVHEGTATH